MLARLRSVLRLKVAQDELQAHNRLLAEMVRDRTDDLFHSHLDIIWRLGKAAEHRDEETGNHVIRVGCISRAIAEVLHGSSTRWRRCSWPPRCTTSARSAFPTPSC